MEDLIIQNRHIVELNLGGCMIGNKGAIGIFTGLLLKPKSVLRHLNMKSNHLTDVIAPNLVGYLKAKHAKLEFLDLS